MTIGSATAFERELEARVRERARAVGDRVALVEVYDAEADQERLPLARFASARLGASECMRRFPLLFGAVASEVGYAYEGVGTDFWPRFERVLEISLGVPDRRVIADGFAALHARLPLVEPVESAFNAVFNIMAWPLAHALMPRELAGPVGRLLARGPGRALPRRGQAIDFGALRAWSSAAEGQRLTDWLKLEGPSGRVLTALLDENASSRLTPAVYARLRDAFRVDLAGYTALETARARVVATPRRGDAKPGRLSLLIEEGRATLAVAWTPLPAGVEERARAEARVRGWHPRLWSVARTHAQNALGAGPMVLELSDGLPPPDTAAYPDAAEVFGAGSDVALALADRQIAWSDPLVFLASGEAGEPAEPARLPLSARTGQVLLVTGRSQWRLLRRAGELNPALVVREADLSNAEHREALRDAGLWTDAGGAVLARHPVDAARTERQQVSPGRPFASWPSDAPPPPASLDGAVRTATAGRVEARAGSILVSRIPAPPPPPAVSVTASEVDGAFDALAEGRLRLAIQSPYALRDVLGSTRLLANGRLIAVSAAAVAAVPGTIGPDHALLAPMMEEHAVERLLQAGEGRLIVRIGRVSSEIALVRRRPMVAWTRDGAPQGDVALDGELVFAEANHPAVWQAAQPAGTGIKVIRLATGRLATPALIQVGASLQGRLPEPEVGEASRRARDGGRGLAEMASARAAWAGAECRNLAALALRSATAEAFDHPLARALCGSVWAGAEQERALEDYWKALWAEAVALGLIQPPGDLSQALWDAFGTAFGASAAASQGGWPASDDLDAAALDEAVASAFAQAVAERERAGDPSDLDPDDWDFGAAEEDWGDAAQAAARRVERPRLCALLAPPASVEGLRRRDYRGVSVQEAAVLMADWCRLHASPRAVLDEEGAMNALLFWLSPAACADPELAARRLARDRFTARVSRYIALRLRVQEAY